jgi:Flp pilus assembly pilin Flp
MQTALRTLICDEAGTTAIEYALIGTLVGVAIISALLNFSSMVEVLYSAIEGLTVFF